MVFNRKNNNQDEKGMNEEYFKGFIGYELKEGKWVIPAERLKQYQMAVGDTRSEYMSEDPIASPAFACVVVLEARKEHLKDIPGFIKDYSKVLHASQAYEFFKPIRANTEITTKSHVSNVYIKNEKLWIETTIDCFDGDELCVRVLNKIVVREGGF